MATYNYNLDIVESVSYNNQLVEKLILNGTTIWEKAQPQWHTIYTTETSGGVGFGANTNSTTAVENKIYIYGVKVGVPTRISGTGYYTRDTIFTDVTLKAYYATVVKDGGTLGKNQMAKAPTEANYIPVKLQGISGIISYRLGILITKVEQYY